MKGDREREDDTYTYSDAMNDWASTQKKSFIRRTRGTLFHPSPDLVGFARVFGYIWRVGLLGAVLAVVWLLGVRAVLKSEGFADRFAEAAVGAVGAESASFNDFSWKSGNATSPYFEMTGGESSAFHLIKGYYLRVEDGFWKVFGSEWPLGDVTIDQLFVQLRSGGIGQIPDLPPALPDPDAPPPSDQAPFRFTPGSDPGDSGASVAPPLPAGGRVGIAGWLPGPSPRFSTVTYGAISVTTAEVLWGLSNNTRGSLDGRGGRLTREGDRWEILFEGGTLTQNWWRGLQIAAPLKVTVDRGTIALSPTALTTARGGSLDLSGTVETGETPELDLALTLAAVPVREILGRDSPIAGIVDGTMGGSATITGSINTSAGVVTRLDATMESGVLRSVNVLERLSLVTGYDRLRGLPLTGAHFVVKSEGGTTTVSDLTLTNDGPISLAGAFSVDSEGLYSGHLEVGVEADLLDRYPEIRDEFFQERPARGAAPAGFTLRVPLEGTFGELGVDLARRLLTAYQHSEGGR